MEICSGASSAISKDMMAGWVKEVRDSEDEDKGMDSKEIFEIKCTRLGDWLKRRAKSGKGAPRILV